MPIASKEKHWPPGVHRRHPRLYYKRRDASIVDLHPWSCEPFDAGLPHGTGAQRGGGGANLPNELPFARPDPHHPGRFEVLCSPHQLQTLKAMRLRDIHTLAIRARIAELTDEEAFFIALDEFPKRQNLSPLNLGRALSRAATGLFNYDYIRLGPSA